jgi:hypothetical protein
LKRQSGELLADGTTCNAAIWPPFQKLTAEGSLSTVVVPPAGRAGEVENIDAH